MTQYIFDACNQTYLLRPVTEADLSQAAALCDQCVGKNLYTPERIREAMEARDQFFWLLQTQTGETVGYLFYLLTDVQTVAAAAKVDPARLTGVAPVGAVCRLQSIGIREEYRGNALAAKLLAFLLEQAGALEARVIYAVCWKAGRVVPLEKPLLECGFSFLMEAKKVWYDDLQLHCPHCNGRCHCDAEIYYKLLT